MKGENILQSNVFEISGNKNNFFQEYINFKLNAFTGFKQLFDKI